jgi:lysophospholipase L1-like esterase
MPVLLTFGDSNTHGSLPIPPDGGRSRLGPDARWPCVAARALGEGWRLVEEGLPGRTAQFEDPVMGAHMDGRAGLRIALMSHAPIDVLTIMLGTNDVKARFCATPDAVAGGIAGLLDIALHADTLARTGPFKVLVIAPPPVEEAGVLAAEFWGGAAKSRALAPILERLAEVRGVGFLDAGQVIRVSPVDGVHYGAAEHAALGAAVASAVRAL